jgi:hypothetical protein
MLRDMCGRRNDNVIAERVATKNATGSSAAFSVHMGKKETQGLAVVGTGWVFAKLTCWTA